MAKRKEDQQKNVSTMKKNAETKKSITSSSGLDEIDQLFQENKKRKQEEKKESEAISKQQDKKKQRKQQHLRLEYSRNDLRNIKDKEWVDDGLGGKFDKEGYTGRKTQDGSKVYKAHLFNKPGFGKTPDCPFDCDCCFI